MKIGYARVSTGGQGASLESQQEALTAVGCSRVFTDVASGARAARPGLEAARDFLREGDTLVVTRLDRLGRTVLDTLNTLRELDAQGVTVQAQDVSLDTSTPPGRLVLTVILALAEWERDTMLARTREGLDAARAHGRIGGRRPALNAEQRQNARQALASGMTVQDVAKLFGVSRWTIQRLRQNDD